MNVGRLVASDSGRENLRSKALIAFLGAGMTPAPDKALLVAALAGARRSVAALHAAGQPLNDWLKSETRYRGIRENAATLAAMEISDMRLSVADEYSRQHPERAHLVREMLEHL